MAYTQNDMSGSLFKNDRKEKDTHPDYTGSVLIDGVEYWQSAWIKTSTSGAKYMSQSFKPKIVTGEAFANTTPAHADLDDGSDIPF